MFFSPSSLTSSTPHSQMFPGTEGWPFPRHQGSCGRLMVWASSRPLWGLYGSSREFVQRVDVAYQLLHITQGLGHNSLGFLLYYTRLGEDMFGLLDDQRVFITDASSIGVIDLEQGEWNKWVLALSLEDRGTLQM